MVNLLSPRTILPPRTAQISFHAVDAIAVAVPRCTGQYIRLVKLSEVYIVLRTFPVRCLCGMQASRWQLPSVRRTLVFAAALRTCGGEGNLSLDTDRDVWPLTYFRARLLPPPSHTGHKYACAPPIVRDCSEFSPGLTF